MWGDDPRGFSAGGCAPQLETGQILLCGFCFSGVPVEAWTPLVGAFMEELMACKLSLLLQLFLRAAVKDLFSSISPVFYYSDLLPRCLSLNILWLQANCR